MTFRVACLFVCAAGCAVAGGYGAVHEWHRVSLQGDGATTHAASGRLALYGEPAGAQAPAPWTPPQTTLSPALVSAVRFAFDHGLPDPRGGEFREVTVLCGEPWRGKTSEVKATGWVMPASGEDKPVVICWNGLPYRPISIGDKKDLDAQVKSDAPKQPFMWASTAEAAEVANPNTALGIALLLRIGRADLAEAVAGKLPGKPDDLPRLMAEDIVWCRFNRAVLAHMRADDQLVLEDSHWLTSNEDAFLTLRKPTATFPQPQDYDGKLLEADALRRVQRGPRAAFDPVANKALPVEKRVAEIVDRLDDAQGYQWGQPGGISWMEDPIYKAALDVGEPMIDPLIDCAEKDTRLTRSVSFGRDFFRMRYEMSVQQLALLLITDITQIHSLPQTADNRVDFTALRAWWNASKGLGMPDRLYNILADGSAGSRRWLDAATALTRPVDVRQTSGWINDPTVKPGAPKPPMRGEPLRGRQGPSVTDLLGKRALQMMPSGKWPSSMEMFAARDSVWMARNLSKWDPLGARDGLKALYDRLNGDLAAFDQYTPKDWISDAQDMLGELIGLRLKAQDKGAEGDYESWILASAPPERGFVTTTRFNPLIEQPQWGEHIARKLFVGDQAPWNPTLRLRDGDRSLLDAILRSRLPKLDAVRECLERGMADRTVIGEVSRQDRGLVKYTMNGNKGSGGYSNAGMDKPDPRDPATGVKVPLRVCDMIAMTMNYKGQPEFRPYWSDADKDVALREVIRFLRKSGAKLVDLRPGPPMADE